MKVLHFSALDGRTGAGVAAARIHTGLLARGVQSRFCVAHPSASLPESFTPAISPIRRVRRAIAHRLENLLLRRSMRGYDYVLSTGLFGIDMAKIVQEERPDVVQLHWIAGNAFCLSSLAGVGAPIVWRLSDQWPFCGLQHLEAQAETYTRSLPRGWSLPLLWADLSEFVRRRKARTYGRIGSLTLACPSRWIMAEARRSALLGGVPGELIPTSCDTELFKPRDRQECRMALGLPPDEAIVLVGATSMGTRWKGGDLFLDALGGLSQQGVGKFRLVTFGADMFEAPPGMAVTHLGAVGDRSRMALLFNAADVFVAPSRMENLANTVLEALACGTPAVAFAIGGMPDMIEHHVNGALALPFDSRALASGILWALERRVDPAIRAAARKRIMSGFSLDQEIAQYMALYRRLLSQASAAA